MTAIKFTSLCVLLLLINCAPSKVSTKEKRAEKIGAGAPRSVATEVQLGEELALSQFLESWKAQDWIKMAKHCQLTWRSGQKNPSSLLDAWFGMKVLEDYEVRQGSISSPEATATDVTAIIAYRFLDEINYKEIHAKVIRENRPYSPSTKGAWGVNPISALEEKDYVPRGTEFSGLREFKPFVMWVDRSCNVRSGPGMNFDVLRVASKGDKLTIQDTSGEWYCLGRVSNRNGEWVHNSVLSDTVPSYSREKKASRAAKRTFFSLTLSERKQIFLDLVREEDRYSPFEFQKARSTVCRKYNISEDTLVKIVVEGIEHQWPPL
jgi:hypothetical protein